MHRILFLSILLLCTLAPNCAWAGDYHDELQRAYDHEGDGEYQKAVDILLAQTEVVPKDSDILFCDIYSHLAIDFFRLGDNDKAIEYGKKCLALDEARGDEEDISISLNNLAGICLSAKRYELAEEYLKKGIEIEERLKNDAKLAVRLGMLCEVYSQQQRTDEAIRLARKALDLDRKGGREDKVAIRLSQLGAALAIKKSWSEAEKCLKESYTLLTKYENLSSLCITTLSLGATERGLNNRSESERYLMECVRLAEKLGQRQTRKSAYNELATLYLEEKNYERACHYLNAYKVLNDSLQTETIHQQISEMQVKYETGKKELEIAQDKLLMAEQETTIERQRIITIFSLTLLVILAIALVMVFTSLQTKKRMIQLRDQLMRIISHDLKNPALASQKTLRLLNDHYETLSPDELHTEIGNLADNADSQVSLLFDLLVWAQLQTKKLVIKPIRLNLTTMAAETTELYSHQAAQKNVTLRINTTEPAYATADRQTVSIILRNIIHNAIKFSYEGGVVEVDTNGSTITVTDHGVGMNDTQQRVGTSGEGSTGVGMNLVTTLVKKNGANMAITSHSGKGTSVSISFPKE